MSSEEEATDMISELQDSSSRGGFRFHKILSSSPDVIRKIKSDDRATGLKDIDIDSNFYGKGLSV